MGIAGLTFALAGAAAPPGGTTAVEFTPDGKMKRPEGYREWIYIGTPLAPNDMSGGDPRPRRSTPSTSTGRASPTLRKTGESRDGTVLVKDLVSVGTKEAPSGKSYFEGDSNGVDVSIKDSKRFKDEPGNWAYFTFGRKPPLKADS